MKISTVLPRMKVDVAEISKLWGAAATYGYESIAKLGWDENPTTLAVQSIIELEATTVTSLHLIGDVDLAVLVAATGIDASKVKQYPKQPHLLSKAIYAVSIEENAILTVVDHCEVDSVSQSSVCGAAAVSLTGPFSIDYNSSSGSGENLSLIYNGEITGDTDMARIRSQLNLMQEDLDTILMFYSFRNIRRAKPMPSTDAQKEFGYCGLVTPLVEMSLLASKGSKSLQIGYSDTQESGRMHISWVEAKVLITRPTRKMNYSQLLQRTKLGQDPGTVAQGAYISTPVYLSNSDARYRLQSKQCKKCQTIHFPPRRICKECGGETEEGPFLSRRGVIYAKTSILKGAAPTEFDYQQLLEGEYGVAIVEFPEGPRVITQLSDVDLSNLSIGDPVKMVFRKIYFQENQPRYGYKFIQLKSQN